MSLFSYIQDEKDLSSINENVVDLRYDQINPETNVIGGENFGGKSIRFKWSNSGTKYSVLDRSYFRIRMKLTQNDGATQLSSIANIAPSMSFGDCLWDSCEFRIGGKTVERISNNIDQIGVLRRRMMMSKSNMDSFAERTNLMEASQLKRKNEITSDGLKIDSDLLEGSRIDRVGLGFDAATNQFALAANTGVVTFTINGGGALPDIRSVFKVGDIFEYQVGANAGRHTQGVITEITGATTMVLRLGLGADGVAQAASGVPFFRVRKLGIIKYKQIINI